MTNTYPAWSDTSPAAGVMYDLATASSLNDTVNHSTARQAELDALRAFTILLVQKVLTPLVVLVGCVGNTINITILTRPSMRSSTNCYLTALAVCDMLYLIFAFTMSLKHYTQVASTDSFVMYKTYIGKTFTDIWSNTGIWLTVTFTAERYIVVCHPMWGQVWCTPTCAKQLILAVCIAATLVTFPEIFSETVERKITNTTTNATHLESVDTQFASTASYSLGYNYTNQVLFTFLPLLLLAVFNVLLIRALVAAARRRDVMTSRSEVTSEGHSKDQQKITLMLIVIVIVFILCQLPSAISILYRYAARNMSRESHTELRIASNYLNLLVMINSAFNFVLYSTFSTKFRVTFRNIYCGCLLTEEEQQSGRGHGSRMGHKGSTMGSKKGQPPGSLRVQSTPGGSKRGVKPPGSGDGVVKVDVKVPPVGEGELGLEKDGVCKEIEARQHESNCLLSSGD